MLLVYEFCIHGLFKLILRQKHFPITNKKSSIIREVEQDAEIEEILKTNETIKELSSKDIPLSSKYTNELLRLFIDILAVSGTGIKTNLNQNSGNEASSVKKAGSQSARHRITSESESRQKQKSILFKAELERLCDDYNDQKALRRQETSGNLDRQVTMKVPIKIEELFFLCNIEINSGKGSKTGSNVQRLTKDPEEILQNVTRFIQINQEELKKEVLNTLKNSSLKLPRLVSTNLNIFLGS